ncbi:MAG: PorT family protein [Bacteroidales bacterium]|nr:PorT family protein [Bacteroidales bacterium]MBN2763353.1 PorT family protein [Bacteroidales bacterium]
MKKLFLFSIAALFAVVSFAQKPKVKNDPTHDEKPLHFGFSLGINTMDFRIQQSQTGIDSSIAADVEHLQPGFHVHAISNLRLAENFDLRFTPGISFGGERQIAYREFRTTNLLIDSADLPVIVESNFLEFPLILKYKSKRLNNFRPYLLGAFNTRIDLAATKKTWGRSKKENNLVLVDPLDFYYELGFGMDFYLHYFKFGIEFKYSVGLTDVLKTSLKRKDEPGGYLYPPVEDAIYTNVIDKMNSRMFMISFHFE